MRLVFRTRERTWGGGEEILVRLMAAARAAGHEVTLEAPADSVVAARWSAMGGVASPGGLPDHVVCNDFRSLWTSLARRLRVPHSFVVHGWWQTSRLRNLLCGLARVRVVAVSGIVRDAVRAHGGVRGDVPVLPVAPDPARFRPPTDAEAAAARASLGVPPREFTASFVGRFQSVKRPLLFLDACRAGGVAGVLVTPAEPQTASEDAVAREIAAWFDANPDSRVRWCRGGDARDAVWASDVFVSTSVFESLGVAMLEALACGRPVVTTAEGGPSDFLADGVNGVHLPVAATADVLAAALADLRDGAGTYRAMATRAEATVEGRGDAHCLALVTS